MELRRIDSSSIPPLAIITLKVGTDKRLIILIRELAYNNYEQKTKSVTLEKGRGQSLLSSFYFVLRTIILMLWKVGRSAAIQCEEDFNTTYNIKKK